MKRPAVLLDRDGTLNFDSADHVKTLAEFRPIPGAFEAVGALCRAGWPVCVVTNQSGLGRGLTRREALEEIHAECARLAALHGGSFDGFHVCPHEPGARCECRKPLPGLLLEAARAHGYDLFRSYCIGDSLRDLAAGRAAGATSLLVRTGNGEIAAGSHPEHLTFADLADAVDWILTRD